jgi:diguanylate cyclase (GGDEF)-like protein
VNDVDALTGLRTFHALPSALKEPVAAIFFDVDGLRYVNYRCDHLAGDEVLRQLGAWLAHEAETLRGEAFRVAGDEFILLLPSRTLDDALLIAKRLVASAPASVSAVVFTAEAKLCGRLRAALDEFAEELYRVELASGRDRGNVVMHGVAVP